MPKENRRKRIECAGFGLFHMHCPDDRMRSGFGSGCIRSGVEFAQDVFEFHDRIGGFQQRGLFCVL